ncbi:MAG: osmotic sensory protein [Acidobacteria bacterium]|nr:MAG: osmotic sensory protein [Acidobacteriota bacterium]
MATTVATTARVTGASAYPPALREDEPVRGYETDYGRTTNRFYGRSGFDFGREDYGRGPDRPNFGSARSDYGNRAYGGRIDERGPGREGRGRGWRGWWDRAADEVLSWFGDEDAERRRRIDELREARGYGSGKFRGRGPKNYRRSDERIHEEINDRLTDNEWLDASDIDVSVNSGIVILTGTVDSRYAKRLAEDIADSVSGVINVQNNLLVENRQTGVTAGLTETTTDASRTLPAADSPEANRASKAAGKS